MKSIHRVKDIWKSFQDSFTVIVIRKKSDRFFSFVPECEETATDISSDS